MSTLEQWAAELGKVAQEYPDKVHEVVEDAAKAVRDEWRRRWRGMDDAPYLWAAVTYDVHDDGPGTHAEIGPDKSLPQGPLGNLVEFGSIKNPPHPGGTIAMETEEPRFVQAAEDMLARLLEEGA